jgi:small subunit ribosomal protein S16
MVKIRLMRVGKRKQPAYRVVVADARSPRDGRIIEAIGHYQPLNDPSLISIDGDRALYWLRQGAQPSNQVRNLLRISGAWSAFTGEAPPPPLAGSEAPAPTPRRPVKATVAASVEAEGSEEGSGAEASDEVASEVSAGAPDAAPDEG